MKGKIECLIQEYSSMVLQIAHQYSFNKSEAEDITQEVFIKLFQNLKKIKNKDHIKAWLIRVTINLTKNFHRSSWNQKVTSLEEDISFETKELNFIVFMSFISSLSTAARSNSRSLAAWSISASSSLMYFLRCEGSRRLYPDLRILMSVFSSSTASAFSRSRISSTALTMDFGVMLCSWL